MRVCVCVRVCVCEREKECVCLNVLDAFALVRLCSISCARASWRLACVCVCVRACVFEHVIPCLICVGVIRMTKTTREQLYRFASQ